MFRTSKVGDRSHRRTSSGCGAKIKVNDVDEEAREEPAISGFNNYETPQENKVHENQMRLVNVASFSTLDTR